MPATTVTAPAPGGGATRKRAMAQEGIPMSTIPEDLRYSQNHLWVRMSDDVAVIGITDFAQNELGDIMYVELSAAGSVLAAGETCGDVESVKTTSDLVAPVGGEVLEANAALDATPGLCNKDPYGDGWMLRIKASEVPDDLMGAAAYGIFCSTDSK